MTKKSLAMGSLVQFEKPELQGLLDSLRQAGFRTIGPRVSDGCIVYGELESVRQLPIGFLDCQDGGSYRLEQKGDAWFDYVVGPHSLKNYLFPPHETILHVDRENGQWNVRSPDAGSDKLAVIGPRSCDLHAVRVQDRVFLGDQFVDPGYQARRQHLFLAAVNCRRAAATCFCHSMRTGPACSFGFDVALTELDDRFVAEIGSADGAAMLATVAWSRCSKTEVEQARQVSLSLEQAMHARPLGTTSRDRGAPVERSLDVSDIRDLLMNNLHHPRWGQVAERCLSCANCTMVCPTCFCSHVEEVTDLTGDHVERQRLWASCFTAEHSQVTSGVVRPTTASRYRQWLTHKLATWIDQFGTSGCVGCGRCITWCPVGIDLTEEVAAIRETAL